MKRTSITVYRDARYGFTLRFPLWWKRYVAVDKSVFDPSAEYEVHFVFKYRGRRYGDVLTLYAFRMTREQWEKEGYDDSPLILLAERNGTIFAYSTPEELPGEFIDPDTGDFDYAKYGRPIRLMKRMVNTDVPRIVRTFRLPDNRPNARTVPYLSDAVKGQQCGRKRRVTRRRG
ncbi:hypothetical protein [Paenibacillus flagellatus]|uniref:Uncharacterized protein n=1 Tax=Paenibacillus flagellatus TaxID=2211139 RepID=A0A2V5KCS8_9BACL|nr:hypothetical protein [Paenibacillus flagellatus]PYI55773.1 hypothetical protein DLM86_08635 [Paenibacillus flagellatus]